MPRGRVSAVRSRNMAAIRGKNTSPEMAVRRSLHAAGLRFRLHRSDLPGKPDLVLSSRRAVVFVHGCFWHHHGCANSVWPRVRKEFWRAKILGNAERDRRHHRTLRKLGWDVFVVWECDLRHSERALTRLVKQVKGLRRV